MNTSILTPHISEEIENNQSKRKERVWSERFFQDFKKLTI